MLKWIINNFRRKPREPLIVTDPRLSPGNIDPDALKVVRRLQQHGYAAYIVGGAVRDRLLGIVPKDFDVATSARPGDIRALFRNALIIGRRFRLAHIRFAGGKVIEVATFRCHHGKEVDETPVDRDNVFGTESDDAFRRDFTLNALFYDPGKNVIIDHTGGLADIRDRLLRSIGDPEVRLCEDPVRILRAIKFAAKFNLKIEAHLAAQIRAQRAKIDLCSERRLFEEFIKILKGGLTVSFLKKAEEFDFLSAYLPPFHHLHKTDPLLLQKIARACDSLAPAGESRRHFQFGLLLLPFLRRQLARTRDVQQALPQVFQELQHFLPLSKVERMHLRFLLGMAQRFEEGFRNRGGKKRGYVRKTVLAPWFNEALEFFWLAEGIEKGSDEVFRFWQAMAERERSRQDDRFQQPLREPAPDPVQRRPLDH